MRDQIDGVNGGATGSSLADAAAVLGRRAGSVAIAVATIVATLGVAVAVFFNPAWVAFEQGRADAAAWTGYGPGDLRAATDAILGDLYFGGGDFAVTVAGAPVLDPRERAHMRDVRAVFIDFGIAVAASIALLVAGWFVQRGDSVQWWRGVRLGATVLLAAVVVLGAAALVAFDALFEVFHRIFFAGGSYSFDPRTERLVQLFPDRFWFETSTALAVVLVAFGAGLRFLAGRRIRMTLAPAGGTAHTATGGAR